MAPFTSFSLSFPSERERGADAKSTMSGKTRADFKVIMVGASGAGMAKVATTNEGRIERGEFWSNFELFGE